MNVDSDHRGSARTEAAIASAEAATSAANSTGDVTSRVSHQAARTTGPAQIERTDRSRTAILLPAGADRESPQIADMRLTRGGRITGTMQPSNPHPIQLSMQVSLPVARPFSLRQTITFLQRFPPCRGDYLLTDDSITAAVVVSGRAVPFTIRGDREVTVEVPTQRDAPALAARAAHFIGAADELAGFYAAAEGDPAFRPLVERLHGLHHVRFLTLEEIAVYCVMMQRSPVAVASRLKRRFFDRFGVPVVVDGATLRALPPLEVLAALDGDTIGAAIGHARKGAQIASVVRGVAALGEPFLREAPYAAARDALLEIPGIGPFSAAAILLRGLGRMDELPALPGLADDLREVYGPHPDEAAIRRRYGAQIGYWSFYLKTGAARLREERGGVGLAARMTARLAARMARQSGSAARPAGVGAAHSV